MEHHALLDPKTKVTFKFALCVHLVHGKQGDDVYGIVIIWAIVLSYTRSHNLLRRP